MADSPKVSIPSSLGTITLQVGPESTRYGRKERGFYALMAPFRLNGKGYDAADMAFHIEAQEGGGFRFIVDDMRARGAGIVGWYNTPLTANARQKLWNAFRDAFDAFVASPDYEAACSRAGDAQRQTVVEDATARIAKLKAEVQALEGLLVMVPSMTGPDAERNYTLIVNEH